MTTCLVCGAEEVTARESFFPSSAQTKITYRCGSVEILDTVCGKKFRQAVSCSRWRTLLEREVEE